MKTANGNGDAPPPSEPQTWSQWFAANAASVIFSTVALVLILRYLYVVDVIKVAVGLGLVIFIHELGHFLAAKWCDVHVETFSIGFGKPIPGCVFKYGETTYKIGWIPLGGYVKMVGEGENADTEEAEEDPRSFRNKRVGQRMLIISAGVIMNILLAAICFFIVYSHGVEEKAPIIGWVESGSPAWQEGIHSDVYMYEIDDLKKPVFDDIRPIVMGTNKGETVRFVYKESPDGPAVVAVVEPGRDSEALFPVVGVGPSWQLTLQQSRRGDYKPYRIGSPAASAQPALQGGDKIVACSSDPSDWTKVEAIPPDRREGAAGRLDWFEFHRRMQDMRGQNVIIRVERDGKTTDITVGPAFHQVSGMRMEMGRVAARKKDSPAARARVLFPIGEEDGIQPRKVEAKETTGDKIVEVEVTVTGGSLRRWVPGKVNVETVDQVVGGLVEAPSAPMQLALWWRVMLGQVKKVQIIPLDPLRLPFELEQWANSNPAHKTVRMKVLRPTNRREEKTENKYVSLEMDWDDSARHYREILTTPNSPLAISGLGLAYYVEAVVEYVAPESPAANAEVIGQENRPETPGLQKGDLIKEIRSKYLNSSGKEKQTDWIPIKPHQWAYVFTELQSAEPKEIDVKIERSGVSGLIEMRIKTIADNTWPMTDRGLFFKIDTRLHKAEDSLDALGLGMHRTVRTVRIIYLNLYGMVFGRVSPWTMSGPLTIADVSYRIAGEDLWQFILFIGMINVNLAVINFLPIPVLDGGHMVFLLYEKIRGKPAPESVLAAAMYIGLACILALMCFVLFLDVKRLFF